MSKALKLGTDPLSYLGLGSLVALLGVLDVLGDGLLAVNVFVVIDGVHDDILVRPGGGADEHNVHPAEQTLYVNQPKMGFLYP